MPTYNPERLQAVRIVEALRSGIPTRATTRELPDLRPELIELIRADLEHFNEDNIPTGRLVWGKYGQGKSHFLTMIEHLALDMKFGVSCITLSREVSCHNLFQFYRRVAPIVRTPDSIVPGIYKALLRRNVTDLPETPIQDAERYSHSLPAIVIECMLRASGSDYFDDLYNDLIGDRMRIGDIRRVARDAGIGDLMRGLPRFLQSNADAYFGVLADVIQFCGFKGWVILVDEVELIARLGRISRLKAYLNLDWLLNLSGEMKYPIYTIGAAATSLQDVWSFETNRRAPDRTGMLKLAEEKFGIDEKRRMEEFFKHALSDHCPTITAVDRSRLDELLKQVVQIHSTAYEWQAPTYDQVKHHLHSLSVDDPVRTYIRATLEVLDNLAMTGQAMEVQPEKLSEVSVDEDSEYFRKGED